MHPSVLDFLKANLLSQEVKNKRVLEVGSMDVNGTPRSVVLPLRPAQYIGVDLSQGPGVDVVAPVKDLLGMYGPESFDVVISTEMLEHVEDWRASVRILKMLVRTNGLLLVTTRSPGFPYHPFPVDLWRFTLAHAALIFADMEIIAAVSDSQAPGIFVKTRKLDSFKCLDLSGIEVDRASQG